MTLTRIEKTMKKGTIGEYVGNLEDAVAAIGSTPTTLIIDTPPDDLTGALIIPSTLSLIWHEGNTIGGAFTLTINGSLKAGNYQLFESDINIVFGDLIGDMYLEWWGGKGDNSTDNTTPFERARTAHNPANIQLLTGIYLISKDDATFGAIYSGTVTMRIKGLGAQATTIKNSHATGGGIRFVSTECILSDLEYDNGVSTGFGVLNNSQFCIYQNLEMRNQVGASTWMLNIDGGTSTIIRNVKLAGVNIYNGFRLGGSLPTGNCQIYDLVINSCTGKQVDMKLASANNFYSLQLDEGGEDGAIVMENCNGINFFGSVAEFSAEITLNADAYILLDNCQSILFDGFRINHLGGTANKSIFKTTNVIGSCKNINIKNVDFQSNRTNVVFFDPVGADVGITLEDIRNNASPAITGINTTTVVSLLEIKGWKDTNTTTNHSIASSSCVLSNINSNIEMRYSSTNQHMNSCSGVLTGTGLPSVSMSPPPTVTKTSGGAVLTQGFTIWDSTAGAFASSLAAAEVPGQIKSFRMAVYNGDVVLTVPNHKVSATFTFNAVNDRAVFIWDGQSWDTLTSQNV